MAALGMAAAIRLGGLAPWRLDSHVMDLHLAYFFFAAFVIISSIKLNRLDKDLIRCFDV